MRKPVAAFPLLLVLAGCLGASEAAQGIPSVSPEPGFGAIAGTVTDDEARPLKGILVTLLEIGEARVTPVDGSFFFETVMQGDYTLIAEHPQYPVTTREVTVFRDLTVDVDFNLTKLPEFRPHHLTTTFLGSYDCAAEYLIVTGDCGIIYERVTCDAGYCMNDPFFSEQYQFRFDVLPRWETLIAELTWQASANNALDGMRMYVENTNDSQQGGHAKKVARADDNVQPLYLRIDRGQLDPAADTYNGTTQKAFIPDEGGLEQIRVFPKGHAWSTTRNVCEPTRGCLLGVGAGISIDFAVQLTIFYNAPAPEDFSAVPE